MFVPLMITSLRHLVLHLGVRADLALTMALILPASATTNELAGQRLPLRQAAPGRFELGMVVLDKNERTVSFPASVNQRVGVVEYAVVTTRGKTHESVFKTEAEPQRIHLALLLLGAQPANTNAFPEMLASPIPGERVAVEVNRSSGGKEQRRPLEDFVLTAQQLHTLSQGPWAYNGSWVNDGIFLAQRDGSIVSLHIDSDALINNPRPGREDDEFHHVNEPALPPEGVSVRITIKLLGKPAPPTASAARPDEQPSPLRRP